MRKVAVFLLSALLPVMASAANVTVSWNNPATNTDGSSIPASGDGSLISTRVEYGICNGPMTSLTVQQPATSVEVTGLAVGTWCFRAYAKNTYGQESGPSNIAQKVIQPTTPNPPTIVTVETVAYELNENGREVKLGRNVGSIPLGTVCSGFPLVEKGGKKYYELPLDVVTLDRMPKSAVVVGSCA